MIFEAIPEDWDEDYSDEDMLDRRSIDEEDDEDFLQELNLLAREVKRERENMRYR